jgi:shikimate dehydrogenase
MRLIALLGDPVEHSLSPRFQNAAIQALGLDAEYRAIRCEAREVPGLIREISAAGGAGNVTLPHKRIAAMTVDRPAEGVIRTEACNTFWVEGGIIHGDNTDIVGVSVALREILSRGPAGMRVLLIGAGGSARAAACALILDGVTELTILNRSFSRARELADRFGSPTTSVAVRDSADSLRGETFDLVVNATSLGLRSGDPLPLAPDADIVFRAAFDLVYRPEETAWVRACRDAGIPAADGLEMLIQQGAAAFARWWGFPAPMEVMRAAVAR